MLAAAELAEAAHGAWVKTAGVVIVRQRPGTAKGFFFLTLEDETGIANAIVTPDLFQANRALLHHAAILMVEGVLQKQDGVVAIRARRFKELRLARRRFPACRHRSTRLSIANESGALLQSLDTMSDFVQPPFAGRDHALVCAGAESNGAGDNLDGDWTLCAMLMR